MSKSIPEYVNELTKPQLYTIIEYANNRVEELNKQAKIGIWQVEDRDMVLAEFKVEDYLLAIDKLKEIANKYYNHMKYSKKDLELCIRYVLIEQYEYHELFKESP